jgi:hypothetical protein
VGIKYLIAGLGLVRDKTRASARVVIGDGEVRVKILRVGECVSGQREEGGRRQ